MDSPSDMQDRKVEMQVEMAEEKGVEIVGLKDSGPCDGLGEAERNALTRKILLQMDIR